MSDLDQHVAALAKSTYHEDGACVCRHDSNRKPGCNYARNGFDVTKASRRPDYNSPTRFPASKADAVAQELRVVGKKHKQVSSPYPQPAEPGRAESLWNVGAKADGKNENFKPRGVGYHYPYLHNWHHMIANAMLVKHLVLKNKPEPYILLEVLMAGKYNINGERNIVLLPQQRRVGEVIRWPIHPGDHEEFDAYARGKLSELKEQLSQALSDAGHPVDNESTRTIAEDLNKVSDQLYKILRAMPPGVHIDEIQAHGAAIESKLAANAKASGGTA
jgi:hypothetical protein